MAKSSEMTNAKNNKNDEFYTMYKDVEKELKEYKDQFTNKIIYCNCDNPIESNYWKYLSDNFEYYELKKLISTHYTKDSNSYKLEINRDINNKIITTKTQLIGNGDFRNDECIEILKEADIVITNPPFSLFREYIAQLMEYNKKFLILGNMNAITYKEVFNLIKDNKMWLGVSIHSGDREFRVPDNYPLNAAGYRVDEYGNKYIRVKGVRWFTNIDNKQRHLDLIKDVLTKKYKVEEYPKYDNYDAINVDKVKDIPIDYFGYIGVPITYIDKHNPNQFEIIDIDNVLVKKLTGKSSRFILNGKTLYARIVIKRK